MCNCSAGGTKLDKAVKFRISRSAWCTISRGERIRWYVPRENEHHRPVFILRHRVWNDVSFAQQNQLGGNRAQLPQGAFSTQLSMQGFRQQAMSFSSIFALYFVVLLCPAVVLLSAENWNRISRDMASKPFRFQPHSELPYCSGPYVNVVVGEVMFRLCCEPQFSPFVAVWAHQNVKPKYSIQWIGIAKKLHVKNWIGECQVLGFSLKIVEPISLSPFPHPRPFFLEHAELMQACRLLCRLYTKTCSVRQDDTQPFLSWPSGVLNVRVKCACSRV